MRTNEVTKTHYIIHNILYNIQTPHPRTYVFALFRKKSFLLWGLKKFWEYNPPTLNPVECCYFDPQGPLKPAEFVCQILSWSSLFMGYDSANPPTHFSFPFHPYACFCSTSYAVLAYMDRMFAERMLFCSFCTRKECFLFAIQRGKDTTVIMKVFMLYFLSCCVIQVQSWSFIIVTQTDFTLYIICSWPTDHIYTVKTNKTVNKQRSSKVCLLSLFSSNSIHMLIFLIIHNWLHNT